jgi:hypothetical protein
MKSKKKRLTSPRLKELEGDLKKIERAEGYLEKERKGLMKEKLKVRIKIKKEKEIITLKHRIVRIKHRKK